MTSHRGCAADAARVPLARSFAFRLGAAFAVVAIAAAGITALAVNAAFAARFDRYLSEQQHAQVARIALATSRAYAGHGKWDLRALEGLVPAAGDGTVRLVTPTGKDVWQWDGHRMSWNNQWIQSASPAKPRRHNAEHATHGTRGNGGTGQNGSGQGNCGSWDNCGTWNNSSWSSGGSQNGGSWNGGGSRNSGWSGNPPRPAAGPATVLVAATAGPSPGPSASPAALGPVQRLPITVNGKVVGTALVRVSQATALPDAVGFRGEVVALLLAGGAAGALVSLLLGIFFARRAARPVRDLSAAAQAVAAGDRPARLDAGRGDEFGQISQAFGVLADAAEGEERLRQGFAAEVAHELRTPLTILRSQVEGLRVGVLEPSPAALASLEEEVARITRLVTDLQILGSADAAGFTLERAHTDLATIADQTAREFAGLFEGAGIILQTHLEAAPAWADPVRAAQIVANLLSNALKYTPHGGMVRLQAGTDGPWAVLRVSDTGPGIPADELPHIFDRFFRGRTARPAGTGIGLTVVAELAAAHGGTAEAASQPGQGSTFTIRLPAQTQTGPQPLPHGSFTAAA
jgi:signal transduction histidine kinase